MNALWKKYSTGLRLDFGVGLILQMIQVGASFVTAVLLARMLEPKGYGIYSYAISFLTLISIPALAGLPTLAVREVSNAHAKKSWGKLKGVVIWMGFVSAAMVICMSLVGILIRSIGSTRLAILDAPTTFWALVMLPFWVWAKLLGAALRGLSRVKSGIFFQEVMRPALLSLTVAGSFFLGIQLTSNSAMKLHAIAAFIAFLTASILFYRAFPSDAKAASSTFENRAWSLSVLPLALIGGMQLINENASMVILGIMATPEDVGIFRVAIQVTALIKISLNVANLALAPRFSRLYAQNRLGEIQRLATHSARVILILSLVIIVFLVGLGQPMLRIVFGPEYVRAFIPIMPLILGQLANVFFGSVANILNMTGHERFTAIGLTIAAVANICINLILIPYWGVLGAGIANALSIVIWNFILWRFLWYKMRIDSTILARG